MLKVTFKEVKDIQAFVDMASKLNGKVYIKSGEYTMNAKSLLGVMAIVEQNPNDIVIETESEEDTQTMFTFLMEGRHLKD
ncbi:PTS HPr component phosphorylation site [Anaerovirgula multivorans]|uniref:PTS HPr component phosphorylation site n=1 Tax=Anaerovirgula multivorans TaxID=312168 RepID=A0A239JEA7_9FIRM|nr:HPr family phosphocarrier protein [Anaerovirgula multivorans]SNT03044.1 PTS HPr component phosphorylation site [Anaerovirgula multivorans]